MAVTSTRNLPSDVEQIMTVARYDIFKHLRSRRLIAIFIIEAAILAVMLALPAILNQPYSDKPAEFVQNVLVFTFTNILIILAATMFAGDSICSEFQNRTGYLVFPNPIKKSSIYLGKFLSTALIVLVVVSVWYWVAIIAGYIVTGGVSTLAIESYGLAVLYAFAASSVGFLISSVLKGSTGALVLTFFLLFMIFPLVDSVGTLGGIEPVPSITYQAGAIDAVMTDPYPQNWVEYANETIGLPFNIYFFYPSVASSAAVMLGYIVICNLAGIFLFKRREMVG
ncbi:MAG: ABC transporter permease [Methanomassiliicoccales archaeon]|nr:ABC transporter permease [Methanomassiliicoccales archaeon]MDD1756913.1 ABC transporter permease [Methanomassiliicoccales archaeon]